MLTLTGLGITQEQIATLLGLSSRTMRLYYRRELDTGAIKANAAVAQSLFQMATKEHVPSAAIFWLKARAGWKDGLLAQVNAQIDANIAVGGIDRPPRESLDEWLARRRRELAALDGPRQEPVAGESAQPPPPGSSPGAGSSPPNGEAAARGEPPQAREAERRGAADSAADSAGPATRSMTPQEADWLAIRRRELGIEPDDPPRPNPTLKR